MWRNQLRWLRWRNQPRRLKQKNFQGSGGESILLVEYLFILVLQGCWGCEEKAIGKLQHCGRLQLLKRNQGWIFGSFVEKTFLDTPFKAEMCLWDNLGNSTDLHWEASIGQVSLLLILQWQPFTSQDAFWKGGPRIDKTDGSIDGGGNAFVGWFFDSLVTPRLCFLWDVNNARDHCYKLSVSHDGKSPSQFYRITGNNNNINNIEILLLRICENIFGFSGSLRLLFLLPAWIICW